MTHAFSCLTSDRFGGVAHAQILIATLISLMVIVGTTATGPSAASVVTTLAPTMGIASPEA